MSSLEINDKSIYLSQEHYFEKLKSQLSKDISNYDFDCQLKRISLNKSQYLPILVQRFLEKIFVEKSNLFYQLMHRIDIPDADLKIQFTDLGNDFECLADLVLRRELIKILIREKYSE
tara:strand:+ start:181 stop:534 length:354 start_codon:yes stop_codon:yes gene_type:complete